MPARVSFFPAPLFSLCSALIPYPSVDLAFNPKVRKLSQADQIVTKLETSHRAAVAARGFVAAEQNFIPLLVSISAICSNPNLPNSAAPRVLVPPTAQLLANQTSRTRTRIASSPPHLPANSALSNAITGYPGDFQASTAANHKFRLCLPTLKFKAGLNGRTAIQSTFEAEELSCDKAQQEALSPGVIACRIHDQLTNACSTNQAARTAAAAAQTLVTTLGRNETTADALHIVFGFSIAGHV
ncbi:unnamed protein product [Diplocarpon coronariae]